MLAMVESMEKDTGEDLRTLRDRAARAVLRPLEGYPEQREIVIGFSESFPGGRRKATVQANRRAGKTFGIGALIEALLIKRDRYVVRVLTHRLAAPSQNWIDCDGKESLLDRFRRLGLMQYANVQRVPGAVKSIRFDWGSALHIHDVGTQQAIDSKHGFSADFYWADEAQSIPLLPNVLSQLVFPTLADTMATVVLSGTPGREVGSFFHRACAQGSDWQNIHCYSWQNPHFGSTPEERWNKLVDEFLYPAMSRYGLTAESVERIRALTEEERFQIAQGEISDPDLKKFIDEMDPDLVRQFFAAWRVSGADLVYDWFERGPDMYWAVAPRSLFNDSKKQVASATIAGRVAQLPMRVHGGKEYPRQWSAAVGMDIGWSKSSTAIVVLAWSVGVPSAYVLWCDCKYKEPDDKTFERIDGVIAQLKAAGVVVKRVVADVNGTRLGTGASWDARLSSRLPGAAGERLVAPYKMDKDRQMMVLNLQILAGKILFIEGDDLDVEGRHLRWKAIDPDKSSGAAPKIDKFRQVTLADGNTIRPGDHHLDALRYLAPQVPILVEDAEERAPLTREELLELRYQEILKGEFQ